MENSFISDGSGSEDEDFARDLAAIKAGRKRAFLAGVDLEELSPSPLKEARPTTVFDLHDQECEELKKETSSLSKQVEYFRSERDKAARALKDLDTKTKKQVLAVTTAMRKSTDECTLQKKQLWTKDREIARLINKFNAAETENKRLKQIVSKLGTRNVKKDSVSSSYTFRDVQELRAQLDAARVELSQGRKRSMEESTLRIQAENQLHDMETRALRAEQMVDATEKLLNHSEIQSSAHIGKLYKDLKVLRLGLVELNGELASQASKGKFELGEMERERRIIATKLDTLIKENRLLLEQSEHQDKSLANQSAMLGSLTAHVHQAPVGSPARDRRVYESRHALETNSRPRSRADGVNSGALSPTARKGLLAPHMETEREHEAVTHLHDAQKHISRLEAELREVKRDLQECKHHNLYAPAVHHDPHTHENHQLVPAEESSRHESNRHQEQQLVRRLRAEFERDSASMEAELSRMRGKLEFLESENRKLKLVKNLEQNGTQAKFHVDSVVNASSATVSSTDNEVSHLSRELEIAKIQLKSMRLNLVEVTKDNTRLKNAANKSKTLWDKKVTHSGDYEVKDDDSTRRLRSDSLTSDSAFSLVKNSASKSTSDVRYGMARAHLDSTNNLTYNKLVHAAFDNSGVTADSVESHTGGLQDGVEGSMHDIVKLQRSLDDARRKISTLEAKLAKSEYREKSVSKMLSEVPSTIQVAKAENRVLNAKLEKQVEIHSFAIAAVRSDAQEELRRLSQQLEAALADKRLLASQLRKQGQYIESVTERHEADRKSAMHRENMDFMGAFAQELQTNDLYAQQGYVNASGSHPLHLHLPDRISLEPSVESLSSPGKGSSVIGDDFVAPPSSMANPEVILPFSVPAYDCDGHISVQANQRNYDRLQQMMLSIRRG